MNKNISNDDNTDFQEVQIVNDTLSIKNLIKEQLNKLTTTDFESCDVEQLYKDMKTTWIKSYDELEALLDILEECDEVAFDTEFIKRDTFYPKLALIQVNTGDEIYLIDAPKLDLTGFWKVLSEIPIIIWHACGEDLGIFYLMSDLPTLTNVFDTQIGMAFLVGKLQIGYQKAIEDMLGVSVDKEQSTSDWLARPLSQEQEVYAANDVKYLLPLYHAIVQQLLERNLFEKTWEDCQLFAEKIYGDIHIEDEDRYLSAVSFRHTGLQRAFLQELLSWRENLARETNQPKTFIIKKQAVSELADIMPKTMKELKYETTLHRSVISQYGEEILTIVKNAKEIKKVTYPPAKLAPYRSKTKTVQKAVNDIIDSYSEETGVPTVMVIKKKWLTATYEIVALDKNLDELPKALKGWRKEWVHNALIPTLINFKQELRQGMDIDVSGVNEPN